MKEFFEGFEFRTPARISDIPVAREKVTDFEPRTINKEKVIVFEMPIIEEDPFVPGSADTLVSDFPQYLNTVSKKVKQSLTMEGRTLKIVTPDELHDRTEEERRALRETYGENYKPENSIGTCKKFADGTYLMRVGYLGEEEIAAEEDVFGVAAHEYGHTLGDRLDSSVDEELKADAMEILFMNSYKDDVYYENVAFDDSAVHNKARVKLEQLMHVGIPPQAILAHLTEARFGEYGPDDWRDLQK